VYKALKNIYNKNKELDKNDPFQKIMLNKHEDYLENSNFFFSTIQLQLMNIFISLCGALVIELEEYRENYHDKIVMDKCFYFFIYI
jgi:hypothetical protein